MHLTAPQSERYARQLALPEIGPAGQGALLRARVLVIGAGGLGSPAALYLASAGVGFLRLVDDDRVDLSNLQRQLLHGTADVGRPKCDSARESLDALNPDVTVEARRERFSPQTAPDLLRGMDIAVDATDNSASKFLIADACQAAEIPYCHGGISAFSGQVLTVFPGRTACLRCVFGEHLDTAAIDAQTPRGPLGAVPGVIGSIQATEVIKMILGIGACLTNRMLLYDALQLSFREIPLHPNPECPLCAAGRA